MLTYADHLLENSDFNAINVYIVSFVKNWGMCVIFTTVSIENKTVTRKTLSIQTSSTKTPGSRHFISKSNIDQPRKLYTLFFSLEFSKSEKKLSEKV